MLPIDKCRGQAYDDAVYMSGKHYVVHIYIYIYIYIAALIKQEDNAAYMYIDQHIHSIFLCMMLLSLVY